MEQYVQLGLTNLPEDLTLKFHDLRGTRQQRIVTIVCNAFCLSGFNPYSVRDQYAVARLTGITRATLCNWIKKGVHKPHRRTVALFVKYMQLQGTDKEELEKLTR